MKNSSIRLIELLRLMNGQSAPDDQRRLEARVNADEVAHQRLTAMQAVSRSAKPMQLRSVLSDSNARQEQNDVQQQIAALLDDAMGLKETIAFENECWNSPDLLHDVIVLFQSIVPSRSREVKRTNPTVQEFHLRQRLFDLFPEKPATVGSQGSVDEALNTKWDQPNGKPGTLLNSNSVNPRNVLPQRSSGQQFARTKLTQTTTILIGLAVVVATVAISVVISNWNSTQVAPPVALDSPTKSMDQIENNSVPEIVNHDDPVLHDGDPESSHSDVIVESTVPDVVPDPKQPMIPQPETDRKPRNGLVDIADPKANNPDPVNRATDDSARPPRDTPFVEVPARLAWNWNRVEGLIAVRKTGSKTWSGAHAERELTRSPGEALNEDSVNTTTATGLDCIVLPFSWGQASLEGIGIWSIAGSSDLSILINPFRRTNGDASEFRTQRNNPIDPSQTIDEDVKVILRHGQLAISDATVDSIMAINTTAGDWTIRVTDAESVIYIEQGSLARVLVYKGSANVNGVELKARQQLIRTREGQLEQTVNRESIKWLKKPESKFPNQPFAEQWQESRDVFSDLTQRDVVALKNQPLLRSALATIDPPGQAVMYLANVLPEVRSEGIHWLLAYGHDERRLRSLANEMATELDLPGLKATLPRLVIAINRKRLPPKTDAVALATGLQHRNPAVRRLSHGFLVHLYGNLVNYDSEGNANQRIAQSRHWIAAIDRLYRRLDNARRR